MATDVRPDVVLGRRSPLASTRIVVADRNIIIRVGLRSILERNSGMAVVAEAISYDSVLPAIDEHAPDILIIDLDLGDDTTRGLKICEEITEHYPATKVLVLANTLNEMIVVEALRRGVTGYLSKDEVRADELGKAVKAVQEGETVLGKGVGNMVARGLGSARGQTEHLTDRELNVIQGVAKGLSNKEIAAKLYVTESTVKFHLQNASKKLGTHKRAELVARAHAAGLIK
jgi:DNA-binding NarL/FixJ family response regulator